MIDTINTLGLILMIAGAALAVGSLLIRIWRKSEVRPILHVQVDGGPKDVEKWQDFHIDGYRVIATNAKVDIS